MATEADAGTDTPTAKRGRPAWMDDPERVAAAAAKRARTNAAKRKGNAQGGASEARRGARRAPVAPANAPDPEPVELGSDDLLTTIRTQIHNRMTELAPLVAEADRLERAVTALEVTAAAA